MLHFTQQWLFRSSRTAPGYPFSLEVSLRLV